MNKALKYANIVNEQETNAHSRSAVTCAKLIKEEMYILQDVKDNHVDNEDTW